MNLVEKIKKRSVLHSFNLSYDKKAGAVNRYASRLFFDDSNSKSLDLAVFAFRTHKGAQVMSIATGKFNQEVYYVLELKTMREGSYQSYNVAKLIKTNSQNGVQSDLVQHNIIYDVKHDRLLTPEDVFVPQYVDTIRKVAQGKPVEMITSDDMFIWAYTDNDSKKVVRQLSYKDNETLFVDNFLDLVGRKKVMADQPAQNKTSVSETKVFDVVEKMPEFPGGRDSLMSWISRHVIYPPIAEENGIQGRVVCTFIVERDGSISDVKVVRSIDPSIDKAAVRVLRSMPKWKPGMQNDTPLRVKYTVPVMFRLR